MGSRIMGNTPLRIIHDECNFNEVGRIIEVPSSSAHEAQKVHENNKRDDIDFLRLRSSFSDGARLLDAENAAGNPNLMINQKLLFPTDVIVQPVEHGRSKSILNCPSVDNDKDMSIISIRPTIPSNMHNLLQYTNLKNDWAINDTGFLNTGLNSVVSFLPILYGTDANTSSVPEYVTINNIIPNGIITNDQKQILLNNTQICPQPPASTADLLLETPESGDDDVIFVTEYKLAKCDNLKNTPNVTIEKQDEDMVEKIKEITKSESTSQRNRTQSRRSISTETRKNPLRKAQMNKASQKLAENLSIPPAVFNARMSSTQNKQRAVRQSYRTTGAILCPPSPISKRDFKEWPTEGLHEVPWYNEKTGTIKKFKSTENTNKQIYTKKKPATLTSDIKKSPNLSSPNTEKIRLKMKPSKLGTLAHNRLHATLDFAKELKEFYEILDRGKNQTDQVENNEVFRNILQDKKEQQSSLLNVADVLYDACEIYSMANGIGLGAVANYMESLTPNTK